MKLEMGRIPFAWPRRLRLGGSESNLVDAEETCLTLILKNHIQAVISVAGTHLVGPLVSLTVPDCSIGMRQGVVSFELLCDSKVPINLGPKAKTTAALLSGEMKDTVDLNPAGAYGLDPSTRPHCYFL
jgi:hypothetical protein